MGKGKGKKKVDGRWHLRWTDERGKDAKKVLRPGTTSEEADAYLRREQTRVDDIKGGHAVRDSNPHSLTLAEAATRYLKGKADRDESAITNHIIRTPLGALQLDKVTADLITVHLDELKPAAPTKGRKARTEPLSTRTLNHVRKHLVQVFRFAIKRGLLIGKDNPAEETDVRDVRRRLLDTYTAEEVARLVNAVQQPWRGILAVAVHGLRKGETWGLNVADIDLERNEIRVMRSHAKDLTKNGRERIVPIIPSLRSAIVEAVDLARGRSVPLFPGRADKPKAGQPLTKRRHDRANVARTYARAQRLAKLHRIRFHDLRHTCATLLLQAGVPIERVSKILGHSSIAITMDTYGHLITADLHAAMGRLSFDLPAPKAVQGASR